MSLREIREKSLTEYIWLIFLCPTFWGFSMNGNNTFGQIFLSSAVILFFVYKIWATNCSLQFPKPYFTLFIIQLCAYLITLNVINIGFDSKSSFRDFSDLSRPIFYLFSVSVPLSLNFNHKNIKQILNTFIIACLSCLIFDIIKFFPFGEFILKFYTGLKPQSFNYLRFSGTFAYCYNYGYILLFILLYGLGIYRRKLLWCVACLIFIVLTGSRSVIIATILCLISFVAIDNISIYRKLIYAIEFILAILLCAYVLTLLDIPLIQDIFHNFDKIISSVNDGASADGSVATRNRQLNFVLQLFYNHPLFGNGPLKDVSSPIEIQIGYYLASWGIVGITLLISMLCISLYYASKLFNHKNKYVRSFSRANILWILASIIVGMSTPITDQIRVFQLFYFVQGVQFVVYRQLKGNCIKNMPSTK